MKNNIVKPIGKGLQFVELIEASNNPQDRKTLLSQLRAQIGECIANRELSGGVRSYDEYCEKFWLCAE